MSETERAALMNILTVAETEAHETRSSFATWVRDMARAAVGVTQPSDARACEHEHDFRLPVLDTNPEQGICRHCGESFPMTEPRGIDRNRALADALREMLTGAGASGDLVVSDTNRDSVINDILGWERGRGVDRNRALADAVRRYLGSAVTPKAREILRAALADWESSQ